MNKLQTCLNDKELVYSRGLCQRCYGYAAMRVRMKEWTWAQLEELGRSKPKAKPGRAAPGWAEDIEQIQETA